MRSVPNDDLADDAPDPRAALLLEAVRRNPVPVLLIAAGVGLLFNRMARDSERRRTQVSAERVATLNTGAARGYDPDLPTARPARDPLEKTDI